MYFLNLFITLVKLQNFENTCSWLFIKVNKWIERNGKNILTTNIPAIEKINSQIDLNFNVG